MPDTRRFDQAINDALIGLDEADRRSREVRQRLEQSRDAFARGDLQSVARLLRESDSIGLPETAVRAAGAAKMELGIQLGIDLPSSRNDAVNH